MHRTCCGCSAALAGVLGSLADVRKIVWVRNAFESAATLSAGCKTEVFELGSDHGAPSLGSRRCWGFRQHLQGEQEEDGHFGSGTF